MAIILGLFRGPPRPDHHAVFRRFAAGLEKVLARRELGRARVRSVVAGR